MSISNRRLVILPILFALFYGVLPMTKSHPSTQDLHGVAYDPPVWLSEPMHWPMRLVIVCIFFLVVANTARVLLTGRPFNSGVFRTFLPFLWVMFFTCASYYLWRASESIFKPTMYDFTSLIPFIGFAIVDFIFASRLRKIYYAQLIGDRGRPIPFIKLP